MSDSIEQFRAAMVAAGLALPPNINADGAIHRYTTTGKPSHKNGWYFFHPDATPWGQAGSWDVNGGDPVCHWCAKSDHEMTAAELQSHRQRIKSMQMQREADLKVSQQHASDTAEVLWQRADGVVGHNYLVTKGIKPYGVKTFGNKLLIPIRDTAGSLHSLQSISPHGDKRFHPGGRVKGCYHAIGGKPGDLLVIAEGYATGASIHEATLWPVAVAFNAGNVELVATALHKAYPALTLVMAADDDHLTPGNPGMAAAKQAALAVGGLVVVPRFPAGRRDKDTDFNDLAALAGLGAVRACFSEIEVLSC